MKKLIPNEGVKCDMLNIPTLSSIDEFKSKLPKGVSLLEFTETFENDLSETKDIDVYIVELKKGKFLIEKVYNYNFGPSVLMYYYWDGKQWEDFLPKDGNWVLDNHEICPLDDREALGIPDDVEDFKWYWKRLGVKLDSFGHPEPEISYIRMKLLKLIND